MKGNRKKGELHPTVMWLLIEGRETVREEEYNPISLLVAKYDLRFLCLEVSVTVNKSKYVFTY
jgi:hypothetical protein